MANTVASFHRKFGKRWENGKREKFSSIERLFLKASRCTKLAGIRKVDSFPYLHITVHICIQLEKFSVSVDIVSLDFRFSKMLTFSTIHWFTIEVVPYYTILLQSIFIFIFEQKFGFQKLLCNILVAFWRCCSFFLSYSLSPCPLSPCPLAKFVSPLTLLKKKK